MDLPLSWIAAGLVLLAILLWLAFGRRGDRDLLAPPPSLRAAPHAPAVPAAPQPAPAPVAEPIDLETEMRALLATGRKIEAIKRARAATGLGLAEARDWVEAIERGDAFEVPALSAEGPADAYDEVRALVAAGAKLEAIKRLREATGLGLAEAKARVEAIERERPE